MREAKGLGGSHLRAFLVNFLNAFLRHVPGEYKEQGERRPIAWLHFVYTKLEEKFGLPISRDDSKIIMLMNLGSALERFCEKMEITLR